MHRLLSSSNDLAEFSAHLPASGDLGVDCEFVRERTFWPQLGLVQLAAGGRIALLDPLALDDPAALKALFERAGRVLMHAPGEDFECFLHRYGWLPQPLFDTQLAAAFVGRGVGLGYRALVQQVVGVEVDKGETRSDWLRRPLSESQLHYAAADVEHLQQLADTLAAELEAQGKTEWFRADCEQALEKARAQHAQPDGSLDGRQIARLSDRAARRLQRILLWRDQAARRRDRPKSWLLDNETCQRLAMLAEGDRAAHDALFAEARRAAGFAGTELWELLQSPPEPDLPALPVRPPQADGRYRALFGALQKRVADVAAEVDLPPPLLFPRRLIEALIDNNAWPEGVSDWRESLLRAPLEATLEANR
ncbi:ribonuclease D [Pseudomarimonas salicorniae]|uniref:Ribonuclease D n=1 Tax=Pseudomarimonas salicorniae TaxID=2933270 RepID=A0ABT0GJA7_9GAMM|nr:ribonuclease D [Lysobacter sp. CAU 1642]MCK7594117.1 ribonuclease D [Lysobacter sp. CAU 1642]